MTPTADVQVAFGSGSGFTDHKSDGGDVLVGAWVEANLTVDAPVVDVNVFHTEGKRYTLAIVDPDTPDEEGQTFKTTLLALKEDVQLSATTSPRVDLTQGMKVQWTPPHPQQGTPYIGIRRCSSNNPTRRRERWIGRTLTCAPLRRRET